MAQFVQPHIACLDPVTDPGFAVIAAPGASASLHHLGESLVAGHLKAATPQGFCQRARQVKMVERQNRPLFWLDPEHFRIIARVSHRKNPAAIGKQKQFGINGANRGVHSADCITLHYHLRDGLRHRAGKTMLAIRRPGY